MVPRFNTRMSRTSNADARTRADIEPILKEIVEVLVRDYQPELIILYGSYASGTPTRHSDIDLFIVKETPLRWVDRFVEVKELIYRPGRNISVQPLIYTPDEFQERLSIGDSFVREVSTRGIRLYGRIARPAEDTI